MPRSSRYSGQKLVSLNYRFGSGYGNLPGAYQAYIDHEYYKTYRGDTYQWRLDRDRLTGFALGKQWSVQEDMNMQDRDQVDVVVNMMRPLLRTVVSLQLANGPTGVIYGNNINSLEGLLQKWLDYHWQVSNGNYVAEKVVMRQNRDGVGFYLVYIDPTADYGRGELRIGHLSYNNVFVDRGAGSVWDWSDAPRIIVTKLQRPETFFMENPNVPQDISLYVDNDEIKWFGMNFEQANYVHGTPKSISNSIGMLSQGHTGQFVRPLDVYEKIITDVHVIRQKFTGKVLKVVTENQPITEEEKLFMVGSPERLDPELMNQLGLPPHFAPFFVLEEAEVPVPRIKFHRSVSGKMVVPGSESVLPIEHYPIVPVANEDTDNVESRGESDFQYGSQKLLNAAMSLVLLNAAGSSNKKTMVDWAKAGRGKDFDDFKNDWALPNAIVDLNSDPTTGKFPVQHVGPDPLNPAFFGLVQFFAQDLQFASSIHSIRTGDPSDAPETVGALRTLGRWADDTLRVRRNRHELAIERVFNILLQWTPYHYVFHKFFEITNEESNLNETYQINVPFWNEYTKSWELMNDMTAIKAHYRIRIGSTTQSNNIAESQMLMQMMNQYPSLAKHVIRRMPEFKPHEKQEIIQDMDMLAQAQQRVKSLEDSIRQMQGELARRQQNIEALAKSNEMKNFQLKLVNSKKSQPQQEIFLPQ